MKNLIRKIISLVFSLFFLVSITNAQNIPAKVKEAFSQKFPKAQQVEWGKENATEFEAEFTLKGTHMSANFDSDGNWKETEVEISHSDLPNAVKKTLKKDYSEVEVKHIYKVSQPRQTLYEIAVENADEEKYEENYEENEHEENEQGGYGEENNTHELIFTSDGKLVKKEGSEEDEG